MSNIRLNLWFAFGYSMCFGPTWHGIVGNPLTYAFLNGVLG